MHVLWGLRFFLANSTGLYDVLVTISQPCLSNDVNRFFLVCVSPSLWVQLNLSAQNVFRFEFVKNSFSFVSMRIKKIRKILSADQTSISGINQVFSPSTFLNGIWFLFCYRKFSVRLKLLIVVENSSSHSFQENAEHIRWTVFHWCCEEVEMRGTCLEAQISIQTKVVINSWKLYYDTEDTFTRNHWRDFSIFEGMKKFYYRRSVKKCTKYPFGSRAHLKTVRRLWFPTSDRLETWLIPSGTIRSKQNLELSIWRNLPSYHLWWCLLPLCHALFV